MGNFDPALNGDGADSVTDKIPPNLRIMRILEIFAEQKKPLSPTELNAFIQMPKQSIHRLCQTLVKNNILEKRQRKLYPGNLVMKMASGLCVAGIDSSICHQILLRIAQEVGETVNFVRPQKAGMFYVDRVETNWPFRVLLPIGTHVPFHCSASGKTFLASLSERQRTQLLQSLHLSAFTENTLVTPQAIEDEIRIVRQQGFAIDREEFHQGMVAIAVPVKDPSGAFFAALAIHGPIQRFNEADAVSRFDLLNSAAQNIHNILFDNSRTSKHEG